MMRGMGPGFAKNDFDLLVVEDNPLDLRALTRSAGRVETEVNVKVAEDGAKAIDTLGQDAEIDMVLLDLNLPLLSGHDVLGFMQEHPRLRRMPTVVLTTSDDQNDIVRAYDLGANAFLNKPADLAGWDDVLQRIEAFWLSLVLFPPGVD